MNKWQLRKFYRKMQPKLLVWVGNRVGRDEDAEEIVQDTFMAWVESLPAFDGRSSLETFLYAIAKHEVADYWRKKYAKKMIKTVPLIEEIYREDLYSAKELSRRVEAAYRRLSGEERVVLVMKYEEGRQVREIAKRLRISFKAAESRLFRARRAFVLAYNIVSSGE